MTDVTAPGARADRLLAGRYRLDRIIATGGMAQVWEATDEVLTRPVAVKLLHPHLNADAAFVARFRAEAIAAARLAHPSIVAIYDTCSDDGQDAIVMELVRGQNLRRYLDERGPLEPSEAAGIAAAVAGALGVAHRAGIVHRDIKPANILLGHDGRVLVTDFGIAKAVHGADLTASGATLGTVKYLAPEQVEGHPVDGRTDIYALGLVLYEMLCGRAAFVADTDAATALARLQQQPLPPRRARAGIPKPLEDVVLRALERDPARRYQTAEEFRIAIVGAAGGHVRTPNPHDEATAQVDRVPTPPPDTTGTRFRDTERRWLVPTVLFVLLAVTLGVAGVVFSQTDTGRNFLDTVKQKVTGKPSSSGPGSPVTLTGAAAFDPYGTGTRGENNAEVPRAIDGNPATAWTTEGYDSRDIARLKHGVGIYVTLSRAADLKRLVVTSQTKGWAAVIYVAARPADTLAGWGDPVDLAASIDGDHTFDLRGHHGAAVLLWIVDLGDGPPRVHADVQEMVVTA